MAFTDSTGSSHKFLKDASLLYQDICPEQSRFLMGRHQTMKAPAKFQPVPEEELCPFCFQWRRPDNHHMRLRPKRRASVRVQSALRREAKGKRLSLAQMDILRRFRGSSSALMEGRREEARSGGTTPANERADACVNNGHNFCCFLPHAFTYKCIRNNLTITKLLFDQLSKLTFTFFVDQIRHSLTSIQKSWS
ncbi:UPF0711 protein C18orf21 homolog isoform 2-T2 [Salvelinus alpinus]